MRPKWKPEAKQFVGSRPPLPKQAVKSAGRVIQVLEYIDEVHRPVTLIEVASVLAIPQSSALGLLRTLESMGYVMHDRASHVYQLSCRIALLGHSVPSDFFRYGRVLELMDELARATGETIILAGRNGLHSQYLHVVQATRHADVHVARGTLYSIFTSGTGKALLSLQSDKDIRSLYNHQVISDLNEGIATSIDIDHVLRECAVIRDVGTCFIEDSFRHGIAVISAPLEFDLQQPLAIGVAGSSASVRTERTRLTGLLIEGVSRGGFAS